MEFLYVLITNVEFSITNVQMVVLPIITFILYKTDKLTPQIEKIRQNKLYDANYNEDNGTITLTPKSGEWERTVLFLHGLGDKTSEIYEIFINENSPFPTNYKIILPQAKKINFKACYYFPFTAWTNIGFDGIPYEDDMKNTAKLLGAIIDQEAAYYKEKYGPQGAKGRIISSGHSLGCIMCYHLALTYPKPEYQKAIIGFSGPLLSTPVFDRVKYPNHHEGENYKLPMLLMHGTEDELVSMDDFVEKQQNTKFPEKRNFQFEIIEGLDHEMGEESYESCRKFIKKLG